MTTINTNYDVTIVGSGHNGLVAACYLAKAGLSVLVLERNSEIGGATRSKMVFEGVEARLSIYSYLVSLFPEKIATDLGLDLELRSRSTASWTPAIQNGERRELLLRSGAPAANRSAFRNLTGSDEDYRGYLKLQEMQEKLATVIWPSLTEPLVTRDQMRSRLDRSGDSAWQAIIEEPLGNVIEALISDDLVRGMVFTDGRIGMSTYPGDPTLRQNRSFLYHVIGRNTGEWRVPVGGMGALVNQLLRVANSTGRVSFQTGVAVSGIGPGAHHSSIGFEVDGEAFEVDARFVLCNASAQVLDRLTGTSGDAGTDAIEGAGFKINMLLEKLPRLRTDHCTASEAFAGTVHIDEGYEQMLTSYHQSIAGEVPETPPGEIYCHTLTDDSILSDDLKRRGFQTLTLFGLDMPYSLFEMENERVRSEVVAKYLAGINRHLEEPLESCLAKDANGELCIDAMSPVDLENAIHLPKGNIFHGDLTWPFSDADDDTNTWGVETEHPRIYLCGSAAKRGGAVSGIPGHNAAMKVLETASQQRGQRPVPRTLSNRQPR
ncbi:MAG: phytoene desaturase family protein [Verrucomicrobiales bacterium]